MDFQLSLQQDAQQYNDNFVCDIVCGIKKKEISLGKIWSHFTCNQHFSLVMVTLCNRADHYIFAL